MGRKDRDMMGMGREGNGSSKGMAAFILIAILLIGGCVFMAVPTKCVGTINSTYWKRTVVIQDRVGVPGSGWTVPMGADITNQYNKENGTDNLGNPIYQTYYEYITYEYKPIDTITSEGNDKEPYWPIDKAPGKQRIGNRQTDYYVYIDGQEYKTGMLTWKRAESGETVTFLKSRFTNDIWGIKSMT